MAKTNNRSDRLASDLCREIDMLVSRLEESQQEEKYWREKYNELLSDSISHGEAMMGNVLSALLEPKPFSALLEVKANAQEEK